MENIKKMILLHIPMSICNFRCEYCYIGQRDVCFEGKQPEMLYSPEQVAYALRPERLGGKAFINICAEGETTLTKDFAAYVKALAQDGHYIEIVTNMTQTRVIDQLLSFDKELLKHIEFKCSFHYLELKKRGLLERYAENVNHAWNAGASANVEMVAADCFIPYLDEIKAFSMEHFGALPQLTIARNDRTDGIEQLTQLSLKEYKKIWSQFDSGFWKYKLTTFGVKQTHFCYAGKWSAYINLCTGEATGCYFGPDLGNVFENSDEPFPEKPIVKCPIAHCYNSHAFLTLGAIPNSSEVAYGDIRNRVRADGSEWLQPELKAFFNTKLANNNERFSRITETIGLYNAEKKPTRFQKIVLDSYRFKLKIKK